MDKIKVKSNRPSSKGNRVYTFIDASNLWEVQKAKTRFIDYRKLKRLLVNNHKANSITIYYYTAFPAEGTRTYSMAKKHRFFTYLKKGLGFTVRKKKLKRIFHPQPHGGRIVEKGNMDVELTIDAVSNVDNYDIAVLFTGDSDFLQLVHYMKNKKKKVYIYSSRKNISTELRTGADGYNDLLDIRGIWRTVVKRRKQ